MSLHSIKKNRPLIFLKATVIAMGIVFVVSLLALVFFKTKANHKSINSNCGDFLSLKVESEIDEIEIQGNNIFILTKSEEALEDKSGKKLGAKIYKQKIIKIDSSCNKIINQIEITR